jgi:hypothetical protein
MYPAVRTLSMSISKSTMSNTVDNRISTVPRYGESVLSTISLGLTARLKFKFSGPRNFRRAATDTDSDSVS